jgi:hypothetical protein
MIVDQNRDRILLIGGSGYGPQLAPLEDVWQLDKADKWARLILGGVPAGGSRRAAPVSERKVAYLFGGYDHQLSPNNELYRVDYAAETPTFTAVPQENPPPSRFLHAFVYDGQFEQFFLFGGIGVGNQVLGDTWSMKVKDNRAHWTKILADPTPSPRYGAFYGFDAMGGRMVLFSGGQSTTTVNPARDTWVLNTRSDPHAWSIFVPPDGLGVPPGRRNGCGIFDPSRRQLIVFGGTADIKTSEPGLFVLAVTPGKIGWTRLDLSGAPPVRSSGFGIYDGARKRVVLGFGNDMQVFRDLTPLGE